MSWTDEARVEMLRKLWADGLSASQIAKKLGGTTRNAVICKAHRMGLTGRASPTTPKHGAYKRPAPVRAYTRPAPQPRPESHIFGETRVAKPGQRLAITGNGAVFEVAPDVPLAPRMEPAGVATMETLGRCMCKWPIGDPLQPGFTFCGRKTSETYCGVHAPIAYQPATTTKRKDPGADLARALRRYV